MTRQALGRRDFVGAGIAALSALYAPHGFGSPADEGTPIPFLDAPAPNAERQLLQWDQLQSWVTPNADFFAVAQTKASKFREGIPGGASAIEARIIGG